MKIAKNTTTLLMFPIVLALNSSELYAFLKFLEKAMMQTRGEVFKHIFDEVYSQITDYAEALIADKLKYQYDKAKITNLLEEEAFERHTALKLIFFINTTQENYKQKVQQNDKKLLNLQLLLILL